MEVDFSQIVAFLSGIFISLIIFTILYKSNTKRLKQLAYTDQLTQLPNYHKFTDDSAALFSKFKKKPQTIAIIDLDNFKKINQQYGYSAGDSCMFQVAEFLLQHFGSETGMYRYKMGDEFVILLPETVNNATNKIEFAKSQLKLDVEKDRILQNISFSYGLSTIDYQDIKNSLLIAEERLRQNKLH